MSRPRRIAAGAAALAVAAGTAAVPALASGTQVLTLTANAHGMLMFNTTHLYAHPGRVTVRMVDPRSSGVPHGIVVSGHGVFAQSANNAQPGHTVSVTVTVKKGTYNYYCPISGHAMAGMRGTLIVR